MPDISQLSDEDLAALAGGSPQAAPPPPPITSLSDAELSQHQAALPNKPYSVLPLSEDQQGNTHFDLAAGLTGSLLKAFTAPGDVYAGRVDPMSEEGQSRARYLALTMTPMSPAARAGARAIPGDLLSTRQGKAPVPSAEELRGAASSGYDAARATGAEYPGAAIGDLASGLRQGLNEDGLLSELAPKTHAVLGQLQNPPAGATITIASLDAARKALSRIAQDNAGPLGLSGEREASRRAIDGIDQHIANAGSSAGPSPAGGGSGLPVPASPAGASGPNGAGLGGGAEDPRAQASRLIQDARGNAAARFRSDRITGVEDAAELRAAAADSGKNGGNALRQRLASLLLNDKQSRGFSSDELDAMRQVVKGTATSNTLRYISNLMGGGGGIGHTGVAALGGMLGSHFGGELGAGIGIAAAGAPGMATRSAYNALVNRQVQKIDEMLRMRSPLYQSRPAPALPSLLDLSAGGVSRGLLMSGPQGSRE